MPLLPCRGRAGGFDDGTGVLSISWVDSTLRLAGHQVHEAATGEQGLESARRHLPDVVFGDIGLPDVPGYEIGQQLRAVLGQASD